MKSLLHFPIALLTMGLLITGMNSCKHEVPVLPPDGGGGGGDTINPNPCDPGTVYFQNDVLPFLIANCAQPDCHDQATQEDGVGLFSYNSVMNSNIVNPGNAGDSELIEVLTDNDPNNVMPPPSSGITITSDQIQMIATWINQGAQNNSCIPDCDPNQFTFSATVSPLVQNYCQGCHSGPTPDGGLSLTNYSQISASAASGGLMAGLTGTQGVPLMPYNTNGLSACQIEQVQNWIDAGMPNN